MAASDLPEALRGVPDDVLQAMELDDELVRLEWELHTVQQQAAAAKAAGNEIERGRLDYRLIQLQRDLDRVELARRGGV